VKIFNQVEGLIIEINAFQSDTVEKDQIIIKLDSQLVKAKLKKADITFKQAALDLKRIKQLKQKRIASDEVVARAQTALELAKAEKTVLQTQFEYTQIKAPFSGVISNRFKEPGDVVAKYSHILTLADTTKLKAKINLSEMLLANIKVGNEIALKVDALGSKIYSAVISRVYPSIDEATRQGTFEILIKEPPAQAKPGQLCRVLVKGQTTARLHVPLAAIKHNTNGSYVYKVVKNKTVLTKVSTGIQAGKDIEITQGLNETDIIITKGFIGLSNGKQVTVIKPNTELEKN
jgi:membrane fusion protein (multidrug efflux system)